MTTTEQNLAIPMMQMITGYWVSRCLYVAAKLEIPDLVSEKPMTIEQIAEATGSHAPSLYRVLRALASIGVFREDENGYFHLTPMAEILTSSHPQSLRQLTVMFGEETYYSWSELLHNVTTGENAFQHVYGEEFFPYLAKNPESSHIFNEAMTDYIAQTHFAVVETYDFSGITKLADIGGGNGTLLTLILNKYPNMQAILFDQPHVIEEAKTHMPAHLHERCEMVGGDFFQSVPTGADAYLLSSIVHDWDVERGIQILRNVRAAMQSGDKLLLVETVLAERNQPDFGKLLDLTMLTVTGGLERTAAEYGEVLTQTGFDMQRVVSTASPGSIVEAVAV